MPSYSIFAPSAAPTDNLDANSPGGLTLNILFKSSVAGVVTHVGRYRSITAPSFANVSLYSRTDETNGLLLPGATGNVWGGGGVGSLGWDYAALGTPGIIVPNQFYYAGYTADWFVSDVASSPHKVADIVSGPLTSPKDEPGSVGPPVVPTQRNNRFSTHNGSSPAFPTSGSGNCYYVNFIFVPNTTLNTNRFFFMGW